MVSDEAVLQWAALRESLEEDVQEDAAAGDSNSTAVVVAGVTSTILDADRVKLFREPTVQAFVDWVQEEEESGSEEGEDDESGEDADSEEDD